MHIFYLIFLSLCGSTYSLAKPESLPNVVMILSDDQGFGDYGFMGHEIIETPSLDRLASQSLRYDVDYVTTALCSSSLTTMLTGLSPHEHGTTGNDPLKGISRQPWIDKFKNSPQLPKLLASKGTSAYTQGSTGMHILKTPASPTIWELPKGMDPLLPKYWPGYHEAYLRLPP